MEALDILLLESKLDTQFTGLSWHSKNAKNAGISQAQKLSFVPFAALPLQKLTRAASALSFSSPLWRFVRGSLTLNQARCPPAVLQSQRRRLYPLLGQSLHPTGTLFILATILMRTSRSLPQ